MPLNFFRRTPVPLKTTDTDRLKVLDIVESYLDPIIIPYPAIVFRTLQAEGHSEFTVQLPKQTHSAVPTKELYVKFKKDSHGQAVAFMSMQEPSGDSLTLREPDRLYNWTIFMGPNYKYGPITVKVEDSLQGRWLSTMMHKLFRKDYADLRMRQSIMDQGENITMTGPRPGDAYDGFALGCAHLWSQ